MSDEADADWDASLIEAGREYVENQMRDALFGGKSRKQRQTALRLRGRALGRLSSQSGVLAGTMRSSIAPGARLLTV